MSVEEQCKDNDGNRLWAEMQSSCIEAWERSLPLVDGKRKKEREGECCLLITNGHDSLRLHCLRKASLSFQAA